MMEPFGVCWMDPDFFLINFVNDTIWQDDFKSKVYFLEKLMVKKLCKLGLVSLF